MHATWTVSPIPGEPRPRPPASRWLLGLCIAAFSLVTALVLVGPLRFIQDDSLFYNVVAYNLATTGQSSFNGVLPTNGYHPLWCWIATGVALAAGTKETLLAAGTVIHSVLTVAGLSLLTLVAKRLSSGSAALAMAVGGLFLFSSGALFWSESAVNLLCIAACLYLLVASRLDGRKAATLGLLLALSFLARLDNAFFVAASLPVAAARTTSRRAALLLALAVLPLPAIYLLSNAAQYGDPLPVSGHLKSTFPLVSFRPSALGLYGGLSLAAGCLGLAGTVTRIRRRPELAAVLVLSITSILQATYVVFFTRATTWWAWYYVPGFCLIALLTSWALDGAIRSSPSRLSRLEGALVALCLVVTVTVALGKSVGLRVGDLPRLALGRLDLQTARQSGTWRERAMEEFLEILPDGSPQRILVQDQPGVFQFRTSHAIFPVDGLMTNARFLDELSRRSAGAVWGELGIGFYVGVQPGQGETREYRLASAANDGAKVRVMLRHPSGEQEIGCLTLERASRLGEMPVLRETWGVWAIHDRSWGC